MKFVNYDLDHRVVSLAKSSETAKRMKDKRYKYIFLQGNEIYFYPDNEVVVLEKDETAWLSNISEYSVLEMDNQYVKLVIDVASNENTILITNKCNSNCIMCPISAAQRKNSGIENIDNLMNICCQIPSDIPHITITGGEPFILGEDIFRLFQYFRDNLNDIEYLLLTNGRIFSNKDYFNTFIQTKPHYMTVGIPIHGFNESTHDCITRTRNSFKQTVNGLKRLLSADVKVELRVVVSKINYKYLDKIAQFICDELHNVYKVNFVGLEMLGNARINIKQVWISYRRSFEYMKGAIERLVVNGINVGIYNYPLCCVESSFWGICSKSISEYKIKYADKCSRCKVKDACGGMFLGTYKLLEEDIKEV